MAAFVTSGIGSVRPDLVGERYVDSSERVYLPKVAVPIFVHVGDHHALRRAFRRAIERDLDVSVYIDDLFATSNDRDNRAAVARYATDELVIAGFSVTGDPKQVDKALDRLRLHP